MKKIILAVFVAGLVLASCKKERTCTCKITQVSATDNGQPMTVDNGTQTTVTKFDKVSKKGAGCVGGERTNTDSYNDGTTNHTIVRVSNADCSLD